jgi:hypothetical protein
MAVAMCLTVASSLSGPVIANGANGASGAPIVAAACGATWTPASLPKVATGTLYGVAATSATSAWAVGFRLTLGGVRRTLVEHFNGTAWKIVSSPNRSGDDTFFAVGGVSDSDLWAVGTVQPPTGTRRNLTAHWNGLAWSLVTAPSIKNAQNSLDAVTAVAANDVYAAGGENAAQVLHWDGIAWARATVPKPVSGAILNSIVAVTPTLLWTAGHVESSPATTLVAAGDKSGFHQVSSPSPGTSFNILGAIAVGSASDIWTVGEQGDLTGPARPLALHGDGTTWSVVPAPGGSGFGDSELSGVTSLGASDVWAAGHSVDGSGNWRLLFDHWNGSAWVNVAVADPGAGNDVSWGIASSGGNGWAVGSTAAAPGQSGSPLVMRACGI